MSSVPIEALPHPPSSQHAIQPVLVEGVSTNQENPDSASAAFSSKLALNSPTEANAQSTKHSQVSSKESGPPTLRTAIRRSLRSLPPGILDNNAEVNSENLSTSLIRQQSLKNAETMREKKEKWEQEREALRTKQLLSPHRIAKPLFAVLEERYQQQVELPALEQRKAELARLRQFTAPLEKQAINDHLKKYNDFKREESLKMQKFLKERKLEHYISMSTRPFSNSLGAQLAKEDQLAAEAAKKAEAERLERLERGKKYAEMVKELYKPSPSLRPSLEPTPLKKTRTKSEHSLLEPWKPRKYPLNPMVPVLIPKKEGAVVDYLAQRRHQSRPEFKLTEWAQISLSHPEGWKKAQALSEKANRAITEKEKVIGSGYVEEALKAGEEVGDILLSAVKAKLDMFKKLQGQV